MASTLLSRPGLAMRRALLLSTLFYLLVALFITWPVAARLGSAVAGEPASDTFQFVWNLWWVVEALVNEHGAPSNVTVLHWPDGGPNPLLDFSVLVPLLAMPTTLLTNPVVSYNLWFLLSFPLTGLGGWLLTYYVTGDRRGAFIGGLIFAIFPHKSMQGTEHYLQIMLFLFPVYVVQLLRLLRHPSPSKAVKGGLILALALLVNLIHIGFFLLPLSALLLVAHLWKEPSWIKGRGPAMVGLMIAVALLLTAPLVVPFVAARFGGALAFLQEPGTVRFSTDLLALVTPAPHHPLLAQWPAFQEWSRFLGEGYPSENVAYLGLTVVVLALLGARRRPRSAAPWLLVAVVMTVLALGPFLKVGGEVVAEGGGPIEVDGIRSPVLLPYAALMRLPFYEWGRIPNRQIMAAMLALAVLAGLGIRSLRYNPPLARWVTAVAAVLVIGEFLVAWPYPTGTASLYYEPVWRELHQEGRGALLHLPQWNFFAYPPSNEALFAQAAHGQPIVGGYIHRLPPGSAETAKTIEDLVVAPAALDIVPRPTGEEAVQTLRSLGIATVVLHHGVRGEEVWWTGSTWSEMDEAAAEATLASWGLSPRWSNERFAVYDLPGEAAAPPPPLWTLFGEWHAAEGDGTAAWRWMEDDAEIWLWLPAAREARVQIDAQPFGEQRHVAVEVNGQQTLEQVIPERTVLTTDVLSLPAGHSRIRLSLPDGCQRPTDLDPATGDQRCLGLLVHHVTLAAP